MAGERDFMPAELDDGFFGKLVLFAVDLPGRFFDDFAAGFVWLEGSCDWPVVAAFGLRALALRDLGAESFGLADKGLRKARFLDLDIFCDADAFSRGASVAFLSFTTSSVVN